MALRIIKPGMLTTVQDIGRWGHQSQGVPVSGAMDVLSHRAANRIVGNTESAATLEVTILGPEIEFQSPATVAVSGGHFRLMLDDMEIGMNTPVDVRAGSRLRFGRRTSGARAYVAVDGGIDVPMVLGSRSTHVRTGMGGFEGRALRAGDVVKKGDGNLFRKGNKKVPVPFFAPNGGATLRVLPETRGYGSLIGQRYTISPRSDRMGYRLDGPPLFERPTGEMISAPVATGAVQVPPAGQPILLMADHATSGGYLIAATVITADLPVAGQLAPGDWVEFVACSLEEADAALREREQAFG